MKHLPHSRCAVNRALFPQNPMRGSPGFAPAVDIFWHWISQQITSSPLSANRCNEQVYLSTSSGSAALADRPSGAGGRTRGGCTRLTIFD